MAETAGINAGIRRWVDEVAAMTRPDRILICDGSEAEKDALIEESVASSELIELNQQKMPGCYLHRSAPHDVCRAVPDGTGGLALLEGGRRNHRQQVRRP